MKNLRNIIITAVLVSFFAWYALAWAYESLYNAPRQKLNGEMAKLSQEIENGRKNQQLMTQFATQNMPFYYRSLPRTPNDARSLYSFWLLELLQFCRLEGSKVNDAEPSRLPFGYDYRFTVQCSGTLDQLTRFLFEFYYAPYLHRLTAITVTPAEGQSGMNSIALTIDALALYPRQISDPYPLVNQLPTGWFVPRLSSNDLNTYSVIAQRNVLQAAKGGVDRADYAFLTAINQVDGVKEVWFSVRTDDSLVKVRQGDSVHIGSFNGTVAEVFDQDVILQNAAGRWLLTAGECLNQAFAVP
ncbi:MAG: hypothetical protein LBT46_04290 [Planctomycetaceae bacterium]|jgi:hypothetical protein|nr:hypothetical protein [Planctomycetaceae bacterium]